jgi:hypothetical protein
MVIFFLAITVSKNSYNEAAAELTFLTFSKEYVS